MSDSAYLTLLKRKRRLHIKPFNQHVWLAWYRLAKYHLLTVKFKILDAGGPGKVNVENFEGGLCPALDVFRLI